MTARRALLAVFTTALLLGLAWGCSAADRAGNYVSGSGGANSIREAGNDEKVISPAGSGQTDENTLVLNPLCGKSPSCLPDVASSCKKYVPPVPSADASFGLDAALTAEAGGGGGDGGAAVSPNAGARGALDEGGASGAGGAAGAGVMSDVGGQAGLAGDGGSSGSAPLVAAEFGCQVVRLPGAPRSVVSECAVVGPSGANEPCLTSSDCQAGFACVGDQNAGLCQQYCCKDGDQCAQRTYCAERPLRDATTNALPSGSTNTSSTLLIPVCVPAQNCDLSAPFPCPAGSQCACKTGTACLVVRSNGTTTCAAPGAGIEGDPCPCAWGHVCSAAKNQCLKLCSTRAAASCGDGQCQSASQLPEGWGVCVGSTSTDG
jgi:hypothetical protein